MPRFALLLFLTAALAQAAAPDCDRTCLKNALDQYLNAVIKHDPSAAPLRAGFRQTENAVVVRPGAGTWQSVTGLGKLQRRYLDPVTGQAGYFGLVEEKDGEAIVTLRVRVVDRQIAEAEWLMARKGDPGGNGPALPGQVGNFAGQPPGNFFDPENLAANPPPDKVLPKADRLPREELVAIANSYFDGISTHDGSIILAHPGCTRIENGFTVTGRPNPSKPGEKTECTSNLTGFNIQYVAARRFPIADEETGVVLGLGVFIRRPGTSQRRNELSEWFTIDRGRIRTIHAAMFYPPPEAAVPNWPPYNGNWPLSAGIVPSGASASQASAGPSDVPRYTVDPFWPKQPLPNKWLLQGVPTMVTDKDDHIWVFNRPRDIMPDESGASTNPPRTDCCIAAPAVMEFDTEGNVLRAWGGPGYNPDWPAPGVARPGPGAEHNIMVDREGNVWISGSRQGDSIQKYTADGKFLWDFGHRAPRPPAARPAENNQQTDIFPGGIFFFDLDEDAREIYIVDAKRVLVYGYDGQFKRGWGGHGIPLAEIDNKPTPPYDTSGPPPDQQQFAPALHCVHLSVDGLVYVCERGSDRIQVFTKQGQFVSSFYVHPSTPARGKECGGPGSTVYGMCGTTYNLTFSHDAGQKYVLVADGTNDKIWIHDRKTGQLVGSIGDNGRMAGQFHWIDAIAMDSRGNIYTGEVDTGKRVQKFVLSNADGAARPRPHE